MTYQVLVIAGNEYEFRQWLRATSTSAFAAEFIASPEQLNRYDPENSRLVCFGSYWDNPAYGSREHLAYCHRLRLRAAV